MLNVLVAELKKCGKVSVATASSGVAATLLACGRIPNSVLKPALNPICNTSKNSKRALMLRHCNLLVTDECTMLKPAVEPFVQTLRDLRIDQRLMDGLVVLLAGDF